jgi:hypothetical protein
LQRLTKMKEKEMEMKVIQVVKKAEPSSRRRN